MARLKNLGAINFNCVEQGGLTIWYSYATPVAFEKDGKFHIRQNDWSKTTGKHLNEIDRDQSKRISGDEFMRLLAEAEQN
jgi:hypothetical protein